MNDTQAKRLIRTGTIDEIQTAIYEGALHVSDSISMDVPYVGHLKLPYICYAMMVGRPDVLELFLNNNADVNMTIKCLDSGKRILNESRLTPLNFAVGGYYFIFGKKMKESPKNAKILLEHYALPVNFHFMLNNMNEHAEEYITLLLDYGAKLDAVDPSYGTVFTAAAGNPNPKVLKKLVEEAKTRLPAKKFLKLLEYKDHPKTMDNSFFAYSQTYGYWKREGPKLIEELKLKVAEEDKKPKKESLKTAGKGMREKTRKVTEQTALYAKKQKQND